MLQVRKLVLAVAAATAFSSSLTYALGLGDLSVKSSLNQPLEAEISLLEVRDLTSVEIKSQLASPEDFSKAGVGREFFLTGLKFTPVLNANGKSVIRVTSANPVKEPYLNFLVEVLWPNGRLLREYTILLDPPLYTPQQVVYAPRSATVARSARPETPVQQPTSRPAAAAAPAQMARSQAATRSTNALQGSDYRVQRNDTLWDIAARVGGSSAVHQTMLAIQDLNPNAFIDGNINRMKSGQVLRLPTEQDINRRSRVEAIGQVAEQNNQWKTGREKPVAERQLDATRRTEAGAAPAQVEQADSLRLVADAPGRAQQAADQGSEGDSKALQDQLAVTKERLDSSTLENEDLKSHVENLNSKLEKLERLIALKDNQLAQLQNAEDASDEPASTVVDSVAEAVASTPQAEPETDLVPAVTEELEAAATASEQAAEVSEELEQPLPDEVENTSVEKSVEAEAVVAQEPVVEATVDSAEQNLLDQLMDNPTLLAAAGGASVLALLLLLMAISRRNARKEAQLYEDQTERTPLNGADVRATGQQGTVNALPDISLNDAQEQDDLSDVDFTAADFDFDSAATKSQFKEEAVDPIAEANNYISFGRFNQAADVLSRAVDQEPQRVDLRLKLAEVFADLEDRAGFSRQVQDITEIGGASDELAQIKARYPQMFDVEQVESVVDSHGFDDFNLDDLTLDLPTEVADKESSINAELDDLSALLAETESELKTANSEFDLDLDLDIKTDEQPQTVTETALEAEALDNPELEDFDFDLDTLLADEQPVSQKEDDLNDVSLADSELELPVAVNEETLDFELDEDFSHATTEADSQLDSDFGAELDEVNAELDNLTLSLSDDALSLETTTEALPSSMPDPLVSTESPVAGFDDLQDLDGLDDDFDILAGTDETATKLDLARAYVDMGDAEGARDILDEVIAEGNPQQQEQARELIAELG